jgi:hypothetical protein
MRQIPVAPKSSLAELPPEGTAALGFQKKNAFLTEALFIGLADLRQFVRLVRRYRQATRR